MELIPKQLQGEAWQAQVIYSAHQICSMQISSPSKKNVGILVQKELFNLLKVRFPINSRRTDFVFSIEKVVFIGDNCQVFLGED